MRANHGPRDVHAAPGRDRVLKEPRPHEQEVGEGVVTGALDDDDGVARPRAGARLAVHVLRVVLQRRVADQQQVGLANALLANLARLRPLDADERPAAALPRAGPGRRERAVGMTEDREPAQVQVAGEDRIGAVRRFQLREHEPQVGADVADHRLEVRVGRVEVLQDRERGRRQGGDRLAVRVRHARQPGAAHSHDDVAVARQVLGECRVVVGAHRAPGREHDERRGAEPAFEGWPPGRVRRDAREQAAVIAPGRVHSRGIRGPRERRRALGRVPQLDVHRARGRPPGNGSRRIEPGRAERPHRVGTGGRRQDDRRVLFGRRSPAPAGDRREHHQGAGAARGIRHACPATGARRTRGPAGRRRTRRSAGPAR